MKYMKHLIVSAALVLSGIIGLMNVSASYAINVFPGGCQTYGANDVCTAATKDNANSFIATIVKDLLFALGVVAVIMIIIGAFRYVTSSGNSGAITSAKNTILYAVVGLIVALLAYAIVQYVTTQFQ